MNTTLLGSRDTQVFVEVRPKSTLRIDLSKLAVGLGFVVVEVPVVLGAFIGVEAELIGVAAEG
jgi:hypothetical protein